MLVHVEHTIPVQRDQSSSSFQRQIIMNPVMANMEILEKLGASATKVRRNKNAIFQFLSILNLGRYRSNGKSLTLTFESLLPQAHQVHRPTKRKLRVSVYSGVNTLSFFSFQDPANDERSSSVAIHGLLDFATDEVQRGMQLQCCRASFPLSSLWQPDGLCSCWRKSY